LKSNFESRCVHSLVKVFPDEELKESPYRQGSALLGEYFSFQVSYRSTSLMKNVRVRVESHLTDSISLKSVGLVPAELTNYEDHDDYLLRTTPGLYPDPLYPLEAETVAALPNQWRSLWVTVHVKEQTTPGVHPIHILFEDESGMELCSEAFHLEVIAAKLPKQQLIRTEWFYLDCLADWYNVSVFSEEHWRIIESYLTNYVEYGMNLILTPLFSPPLELLPGNERPTVQLVEIEIVGDSYSFDFSKLERWVQLCKQKGIEYFEFSHLFTQWGAKHAPKIIATVNGKQERIFGWETDAAGEAYSEFLRQLLPELLNFIQGHNLENCSYFHISDEPNIVDIESYTSASNIVRSLLNDYPIIDALSDYDFYSTGLLTHPVVSTEHIGKFIENNVKNLWAYYCCCEYKDHLSNRFFNMPSARTRIIGLQMFKYDIKGFLHWGYNHWYSQKSLKRINPYQITDADYGFPSGDAFLVYPGKNGPISSIRMEVLREAMQDMRALTLLEQAIGKEEVITYLEEDMSSPMTFNHYETDNTWLISKRDQINQLLKQITVSAS
jgi:hypothetical protein